MVNGVNTKAKWIVSALLFTFVLVSVVYAVVNETKQTRVQEASAPTPAQASPATQLQPASPVAATNDAASASVKKNDAPHIVAYYFYTTVRCQSCMMIEAYTREAIESGFQDQIRKGRIEWRMVNVQEPDNQHFIADYQLNSKSVVLSEVVGGQQKRWKNLNEIWQRLDDKKGFITYVQTELRRMLDGEA